jgi:hypothetical protein
MTAIIAAEITGIPCRLPMEAAVVGGCAPSILVKKELDTI